MINVLFAMLFAGGIVALAYFGVSAALFALAMAGLTLLAFASSASPIFVALGLLITIMTLPFAIPAVRQVWVSKPVLTLMGKILPPISDTEQIAIDAGTVGWDGELFSGKPNWRTLLSSPKPSLTKAEQDFLDGPVEAVCDMSNLWKINHDWNIIPEDIIQYVLNHGFLGMIIPKRYGGLEFSVMAQSEVLLRLSNTGSGVSYLVGVPNSLGPGELLIKYGTEEQKNHYLPRLAKGKEIPCFALTAPHAGSDATSISDTGVVCYGEYQGEKVLGMRLNFSKRYITLAPIATLIGLAFRLQDPDGLLGDVKDYGITCALIPRKTQGVAIGRRHLPIGDTFLNGPIHGKDVFVPLDTIIGGSAMAGKGWLMLVNCLSVGRAVTLPTTGTVVSKRSLMGSSAYANLRQQFGVPIATFEGIQKPLARIAGYTYIVDAARVQTIQFIENGEKPSVPSAILKYHCTEMGRQATLDAMDIHGGKAIMKGPKNYLAALYESIPVAITVEGANILTRNLMIFGQGAIRAHPFVLKEMQLARADYSVETLREFDETLASHIGFSFQNIARAFVLGLGVNGDIPETHKHLVPYYHAINRLSSVFAMTADISMLSLGAKLKFKEMLSARLGDMLSALYLASMVIKQHEDQQCDETEWPIVQWSLDHLLHAYQVAFDDLMANFPTRFFAIKMHAVAFGFGRRFKAPSDNLDTSVVEIISSHNSARARLTQGVYLGAGSHNPLANVNAVFLEMLTLKPIQKKLRQAIKDGLINKLSGLKLIQDGLKFGVINEQEAEQLTQFEVRLSGVINVDDFDQSELIRKPYSNREETSWLMAS